MANVSELLEVRLKPTDKGAKRDRSSPNIQLASKDSKEREETRRKEFFDSGFDRWYDLVKDKTIPSQLVEIKPLEAKAIVLCWKRDFQHKEHGGAILSDSQIQLPPDLNDLIDRLSSTINSFPSGNGAFVKLSTRSPKDSLLAFENAHKAYQTRLDSLGENPSVNDKLNLLSTVVGESLKVTTGEEAVKLLVSSDRVGEDLEYALEKGDEEFITFIHLVVREWVSVPQWAEFRGFVSDGQPWDSTTTSLDFQHSRTKSVESKMTWKSFMPPSRSVSRWNDTSLTLSGQRRISTSLSSMLSARRECFPPLQDCGTGNLQQTVNK